jgi:hypothetical protein
MDEEKCTSRLHNEKEVASQCTNVEVRISCIKHFIQKNITSAKHCGTPSQMAPVEAYRVSLMQQMAITHQPFNFAE